jgi:membrane protein implicated in regulation of membrane protease activity
LPIYVPWMYAVLGLVVIGLALAMGSLDVVALCASGLVMEATLLFLAPSPDYRYSHWLVVSVCLAIVIIAVRRARATHARSRPRWRSTDLVVEDAGGHA